MLPLLYDMSLPETSLPRELDLLNARIAVLGCRGCGKTSLSARWCRGSTPLPESDAYNIGEDIFRRKMLYPALVGSKNFSEYNMMQLHLISNIVEFELEKVQKEYQNAVVAANASVPHQEDGKDIFEAHVLDGADAMQADYSELVALQMGQVDGFMLCFDVTSQESVETVVLLHRQICKLRGDQIPMVLCALKSDVGPEERIIDLRQVADLCDELQLDMDTSFFEVSALEEFGVHEAFYKLLRDIDSHKEALRKKRAAIDEEVLSGGSSALQSTLVDSEKRSSTFSPTKVATGSSWPKSSVSSGGKTVSTGSSRKPSRNLESRDNSTQLAKLSEDSSVQADDTSDTEKCSSGVTPEKARSLQMSQPHNTEKSKAKKRDKAFSCGCVIC
ncbi:uncharacterized protein LALA0_S04e06678g [Lachancea lanzarotensis]|uniref:LALA0S04e06678g1_1 n=1 Tax=Lachancea lanzarotensis TaxID=1245769 RepID=A0A0C7N9H6_9SACH|nr:uncharacterized protein LALA0_S04e06678g [Lachancea lanzarotensis]CEP62053.1 LALA0S04e06678g1_1 [Lachancea lanzarotensis]